VLVCAGVVCTAVLLSVWPAPHSGRELVRQTPAAPLPATNAEPSQVPSPNAARSRILQGGLQASRVNRFSHLRKVAAPQTAGAIRQTPEPAPQAGQAQAAQSQITQDVFWSLPYSNPALASQGAELIRVTLPLEAFVMAGVPLAIIPSSGPNDRFSADVLLGADGLPFAIRPASYRTTSINH
jgi:hypothetical protein